MYFVPLLVTFYANNIIFCREGNMTAGNRLSNFINALTFLCYQPREFFGFDLLDRLKSQLTDFPNSAISNYAEVIKKHKVIDLIDDTLTSLVHSTQHDTVHINK